MCAIKFFLKNSIKNYVKKILYFYEACMKKILFIFLIIVHYPETTEAAFLINWVKGRFFTPNAQDKDVEERNSDRRLLETHKEQIKEPEVYEQDTKPEHKKIKSCSIHESLPHLSKGCMGEACGILKYDKAVSSENVFSEADKKSKIIGVLKRCQKTEGFQPYVKLIKYGIAEVLVPDKKFKKLNIKKGDLIPTVHSEGEGFMTVCVGKHEIYGVETMNPPYFGESAVVKIHRTITYESWVKVKLPSGSFGFIPNHDFYMGYYSYDDSYLCPEDRK